MQNFSETFLKPVDGVIAVPAGDGAEAFVDAEDIAAVASRDAGEPRRPRRRPVRTDRSRGAHARRPPPTDRDVTGQPVKYNDIDRECMDRRCGRSPEYPPPTARHSAC